MHSIDAKDLPPPNVLFIVMDDQRADLLLDEGPHGFPAKNIKQLAARGTSFDNTFVTTPICTPGRAELLTGCNSFHNGVRWFSRPIGSSLIQFPQHFNNHGYHTIFSGKWHNDGHPSERGFNCSRRVFPEENLNQSHYKLQGHKMRFSEGTTEVEGHSTDLFVEAAIEEIQKSPNHKPWLCYLSFHSPHDPFDCPEPFNSLYPPDSVPLPEDYFPMPTYDNGDLTIRDELLLKWPRHQKDIREYRARYWQMIAHHDNAIGQLLDTLDSRGILKNTIVVFTSDHGLAVGSHGLLGKENLYDHSCRIPFIMAGPGIPAKRRISDLVSNCDIYPTICDLCSLPIPPTVADGVSLTPTLGGKAGKQRDFVVSSFASPGTDGKKESWRETQRSIRTEKWKLVYDLWNGCHQLYDLENDPMEMLNLLEPWIINEDKRFSYKPDINPEIIGKTVTDLLSLLRNWQKENNDPAFAKTQEAIL